MDVVYSPISGVRITITFSLYEVYYEKTDRNTTTRSIRIIAACTGELLQPQWGAGNFNDNDHRVGLFRERVL